MRRGRLKRLTRRWRAREALWPRGLRDLGGGLATNRGKIFVEMVRQGVVKHQDQTPLLRNRGAMNPPLPVIPHNFHYGNAT
ncbi:hypothetical protein NDU88_001587 [Pleurodeles waltl]|uniref:Uncharacterized protein n=1 Tax=Pleurodeles waltl TaxID=8319 RepID=A0AAV7V882_PLEWA|nr:hypothetical protein NDU88_001587 [Pleurodeles waltl]